MRIRKIKPIIRRYKRKMKEKYGITINYAKWSKKLLEYMKLLLKPNLLIKDKTKKLFIQNMNYILR